MHIWLINHYAVPPQYYPLARQTCFAKYLMRMGHRVTIFAASTVHNSDKNLITDGSKYKSETINGVNYVYIKCSNYRGNGLMRVFNMCEFALKLPSVCRRFKKPDAIVSTSMPPVSCAVGLWLGKKANIPSVAEIADLWPESIIAYGIAGRYNPAVVFLHRLEKLIYKKADAVIFTFEGAYDYIQEQGWQNEIPRSKVFYINNGVDLEAFNYNKEHYSVNDADLENDELFKVVYTGSIRRVNHLGLLIDAAKLIKNSKIKFLIWGEGDERLALEKRVKAEGVCNVVFKGYVDKKYIPYITSKSSLNVVHGDSTSLLRFGISPNKLFDYMASQKPVLSTFNCPYNPSIQLKCGIDVKEQTPGAIADAITNFAKIDKDRYAEYCKNALKGANEYDFKNLSKRLVEIIKNVSKPC